MINYKHDILFQNIMDGERCHLLTKKDVCSFARNICRRVLEIDKFIFLVDNIQNLFQGQVPYQDLIIKKPVTLNRLSEQYLMDEFVARLRSTGKIINLEDELELIVIINPNAMEFYQRAILIEDLGSQLIDYSYYARLAGYQIYKLFKSRFSNVIEQLHHISYAHNPQYRAIDRST